MRKIFSESFFKPSWRKVSFGFGAVFLAVPLVLVLFRFTISPQESIPLAAIQRVLGINYASGPVETARPEIIGHRGSGGGGVTENTLSAICRGIDSGADRIEIDVRKAGEDLVLFHDETVASLTGKKEKESKATRDISLAELRDLQGSALNEDHQIISLETALEIGEVGWVIDIKEPGISADVLGGLNAFVEEKEFTKDRFVLQGTFEIISEYKGRGYPLAYAAAWSEGSNKLRFLLGNGFIVKRCVSLGDDFRYLTLPEAFVNRSLIKDVKAKCPGIVIWTYGGETPQSWERSISIRLGVGGLIVDDVEGARDTFHPTTE